MKKYLGAVLQNMLLYFFCNYAFTIAKIGFGK